MPLPPWKVIAAWNASPEQCSKGKVPVAAAQRPSAFSAAANFPSATVPVKPHSCARGGCVPLYRSQLLHTHHLRSDAWFGAGAVCTTMPTEPAFLLDVVGLPGRVVARAERDGRTYAGPCMLLDGLAAAAALARAQFEQLPEKDQQVLLRASGS